MREFIQRVLIGSIVSAAISAGLLYFAFDQSLRGVETAIETLSVGVQENGEWIRDSRNASASDFLRIDEKLERLSDDIDDGFDQTRIRFVTMAATSEALMGAVANTIATTADTINVLKQVDGVSSAEALEIDRLLFRLEGQRQQLELISSFSSTDQ